jgi:hypothetical protein
MLIRQMLTKIEAIDFINRLKENDCIKLYSDNYWPYPFDLPLQLRDAKNSIMLDVMIGIEKRPGILLYIPNNTIDEIMKEKVTIKVEKPIETKTVKPRVRKRK